MSVLLRETKETIHANKVTTEKKQLIITAAQ